MPAGPEREVGSGLLPPIRASGKRIPEPRLLKKSVIRVDRKLAFICSESYACKLRKTKYFSQSY